MRDLDHMDEALAEGSLNYLWFEFLPILVAKRAWQAGGAQAFVRFRDTLRNHALTNDESTDG